MPKISGLPSDTSPLVSDIVPMVDNTAVTTKKVLLSDLITTIFNNAPAVASSGWNTMSQVFTYGTNNGNKEFTVTTPNDVSGLLWPGMRMKFNRGTTPPTQSMAFTAASSQYATKASPAGLSFTGAFTAETWIYLNSYQGFGMILSRLKESAADGGWYLRADGGRVEITYYDSGAANSTTFYTNQEIPLKTWVHIAAVVTSPASQTGIIYFNATVAPTSTAAGATSLVQGTGPLSMGAFGVTPSQFGDFYLSETRLWSNAQSQAQIKANMTKNLIGNEANLVGLWPGNGNFNDLTSNSNTLIATNGAIATQASNPSNSTEYAIVTKVSYVNPTTTVTLFAGNAGNIPNMALSSPQYSSVRAPYGFPAQRGLWQINNYIFSLQAVSNPVSGPWYNAGNFQISVPTGEWTIHYSLPYEISSLSNGTLTLKATLSTSSSSELDRRFTTSFEDSGGTAFLQSTLTSKGDVSLSTATIYYALLQLGTSAQSGEAVIRGDYAACVLTAECAYL